MANRSSAGRFTEEHAAAMIVLVGVFVAIIVAA